MKNSTFLIIGLLFLASKSDAITMDLEISTYIQEASVTEFGTLTGTSEQVTAFLGFMETNWNIVLNEIDVVAPDERRQLLLITAAESLDPSDYLAFLSTLLDKYQAGKVQKNVALAAMSPGAKKYCFFAFNYQHPSVQALCERVKTIFPDNSEMQELMTDTLSGDQRKQAGAALASENRPEPETLPAQ